MVVDANTGQAIFSKNADQTKPIASITKLMTAMVVLDASPSMQETISVSEEDVDYLKHTTSRLPVGTRLSRYEMLRLSLMSSENRAASSLARHYPGGKQAFINAMNNKASRLGMTHTRFYDSTGLTPGNVSTAEDLVKMVRAASQYDLIHEFTTTPNREVAIRPNSTPLQYKNTNVLVRGVADDWDIKVSKTGYTQEAGRCLVMMAVVANRKAVMVMLDSEGKLSPVGDANRLKDWIESGHAPAQLASR
ncbi:MAG: D-alanyl-D-alanine endopeptidase [Cellvibrionales bacterium]|nr:D-alanyl-D-alanine endopeptidase [Cellvibrionales bacterium]